MEIKEITQKSIWEDFLLECEEKTFLDSWNWGEFQKMTGNKIWRLGIVEEDKSSSSPTEALAEVKKRTKFSSPFTAARVYNDGELSSVALVIKTIARRGTFLFVPHGPALAKATAGKPNIKYEILKTLLDELKKIAKEEKVDFVRISPIWERNEENIKVFKELSFREAPIHMHPELTWELDVTKSEEELLKDMNETCRYSIKRAMREGVEIFQSQRIEDVEIFNRLYHVTVNRHKFTPFSLNYLKNEFSTFQSDNQISVFLGKYKNEILSSAMIIYWQGTGFYHQGASLLKYPKVPVSHLLQWEAIKEAKRRDCKTYNFWGIASLSDKSHPWAGLTLFKMGFGGYKKEFVKTQDFPLSKLYWLTYIFEKIRKRKRGL